MDYYIRHYEIRIGEKLVAFVQPDFKEVAYDLANALTKEHDDVELKVVAQQKGNFNLSKK